MDEQWTGQTLPNNFRTGSSATAELTVYTEIGEDDVILGRGKKSYNHRGNVLFRKLVLDRALAYKQKNKTHRRRLARDIIHIVQRNGGKFLRPIEPPFRSRSGPSEWLSVPDSAVVTKVKQALRDVSSRIPYDQLPKSLSAAGQSVGATTSMPITANASRPRTLASAVLPPSHPKSSADGPSHPSLGPQSSIGQRSEYALLGQLASLQKSIQETQQRVLQLMGPQVSCGTLEDRQMPPGLQDDQMLLQQHALLLRRLNTPMTSQRELTLRLMAHQRDLMSGLNSDLYDFASSVPGSLHVPLQGTTTMHAQHPSGMNTISQPDFNPLRPHPHPIGTAHTTRQLDCSLGGMDSSLSIPTEESLLLTSNPSLWAAHPPQGLGNEYIRGLVPTPIETVAATLRNLSSHTDRQQHPVRGSDNETRNIRPLDSRFLAQEWTRLHRALRNSTNSTPQQQFAETTVAGLTPLQHELGTAQQSTRQSDDYLGEI